MRITYSEIVKVSGYTYLLIFDRDTKKWGAKREFNSLLASNYRKTKEEVIDWIKKDATDRILMKLEYNKLNKTIAI